MKFRKNLTIILVSILFMCFLFQNIYSYSYYVGDSEYVWSETTVETSSGEEEEDFLDLSCESAILIEQTTGEILYEKSSHEQLRPASVTKIMTILLIMEAIDSGQITYDTEVTCSENAAAMGGSQIWLEVGETLTVDEMLKAICVVSANDCSVAMAEYISGTEEAFVQKMNDKAKELGMNDTVFKNCHGIDEDGHVTSSYDIALMSKELLNKYPEVTNYTTIWMDTLRDGESELVNTNKLIRTYEGATGLKTGSTSLALYNLSASATRDGLSLIAVVMRAPSSDERVKNAKTLLDYGFSNYEYPNLSTENETVQNVSVQKSVINNVNLVYETTSGTVIKKGNSDGIINEIIINEEISAPINKGEILGTVNFYLNDELIDAVNLIAEEDIKKMNSLNMFEYISNLWSNLLRE